MKTIAKNQTIEDFVLYDRDMRDSVFRDMLDRLTPDQRVRFTTGEYTEELYSALPCIQLSASGEY